MYQSPSCTLVQKKKKIIWSLCGWFPLIKSQFKDHSCGEWILLLIVWYLCCPNTKSVSVTLPCFPYSILQANDPLMILSSGHCFSCSVFHHVYSWLACSLEHEGSSDVWLLRLGCKRHAASTLVFWIISSGEIQLPRWEDIQTAFWRGLHKEEVRPANSQCQQPALWGRHLGARSSSLSKTLRYLQPCQHLI